MSFLGFGASQSDADTDTLSSAQQASDSAIASSLNQNLSAGKNATINIATTDLGAVSLANQLSSQAITAANAATNTIAEFSAGSIQENTRVTENALTFAAGSQDKSFALAEDAFNFGAGAFSAAGDLIEGNVENVLRASEVARNDALEFGAGVLQQTQGAILTGQQDSFLFAGGAFNTATGLAESSIDLVGREAERNSAALRASNQDALLFSAGALETLVQQSTDVFDNTLDIVRDIADDVFTNVSNTTANTLASVADAQERTVTAIGEQTKSEATQSFDKLTKLAGYGFLALAAATVALRFV